MEFHQKESSPKGLIKASKLFSNQTLEGILDFRLLFFKNKIYMSKKTTVKPDFYCHVELCLWGIIIYIMLLLWSILVL